MGSGGGGEAAPGARPRRGSAAGFEAETSSKLRRRLATGGGVAPRGGAAAAAGAAASRTPGTGTTARGGAAGAGARAGAGALPRRALRQEEEEEPPAEEEEPAPEELGSPPPPPASPPPPPAPPPPPPKLSLEEAIGEELQEQLAGLEAVEADYDEYDYAPAPAADPGAAGGGGVPAGDPADLASGVGPPSVPAAWFSEGVPAGQEYLLNAISQALPPGAPQIFEGARDAAQRPSGGAGALRRGDLWEPWHQPFGEEPPPTNVRALPALSPDGGVLAWDSCRSAADVFTVVCGEPGEPRGSPAALVAEVRGARCDQDSFSLRLDGLRRGATYECAVAASSAAGNSTVSAPAYLVAGFTPAATNGEGGGARVEPRGSGRQAERRGGRGLGRGVGARGPLPRVGAGRGHGGAA